MASPTELSLDCKPHHSYSSMLLKPFADHHSDHTHTYNLENFLSRLEEERLKIDAFRRELPLCMQLLTDAMEASRQELEALRGKQGTETAILEEFIPLKHPTAEKCGKESSLSDKANWMISAQLWSQTSNEETKPQSSTMLSCKQAEIGLGLDSKQRNYGGGAFLPFSKQDVPELGLASCEKQTREEKKCTEPENDLKRESSGKKGGNENGGEGSDQGKETTTVSSEAKRANSNSNTTSSTTQTHRKARRCWSPDLHRRFVNALQMLGGSQVATPKQIRELMKVDGLTNDEVKSHLQKYRLHTRRPSPIPQAGGAPGPQLVVLGGIWVPPEYTTAATTANPGAANAMFSPHLASHAPLPHYCTTTPVPQDFYAAVPPQPQNHNLNVYRTMSSHTQRSPEYEVRGGGERSESIEDVKSESIESGENERERKRDW